MRRAAKKHRAFFRSPTQYSHEDYLDGSHLNVDDSEATPHAELPAAIGGVEMAAAKDRRTTTLRSLAARLLGGQRPTILVTSDRNER